MKVVLGCGSNCYPGAVNVDIRSDVGADVVADVHHLPFADRSVDRLVAEDILEHFPETHIRGLLVEWARVLAGHGRLEVKVPNLLALANNLLRGRSRSKLCRTLIRNIYGGHRYGPDGAFDTHHTGWTPKLLAEELGRAGFQVLSNDEAINMRVEAELR